MTTLESLVIQFPQRMSTVASELAPPLALNDFEPKLLPSSTQAIIGRISSVRQIVGAKCNLVLLVRGQHQQFVLKVAKGTLRKEQLRYEYSVLREVGDALPVLPLARPLDFSDKGDYSYFIQSYIEGTVATLGMHNEQQLVGQRASCLKSIHSLQLRNLDYNQVLNEQLHLAQFNMEHGRLDPEEFNGIGSPQAILETLRTQRPQSSSVVLLHGDYRPKNILLSHNAVSGLVDWGFCMAGDAYYDLAIILWYLKDNKLKQTFLDQYGLRTPLDAKRLEYFDLLSKFFNV